jgi:hypothetical protein
VYTYEISLRARSASASSDPVTFKIWNIGTPSRAGDPARGMNVVMSVDENENNIPEEIRNQEELAAILTGSAFRGKTYVLVNDIALTGTWTPIGTDDYPFQGKFYGNGHRISIDGIAAVTVEDYWHRPMAVMGLFGAVAGGTVRDLTVQYNDVVSLDPGTVDEFRFGGITGRAWSDARFENVQVLGSVTLGGSDCTAYTGGLIGLMTGTARMTNAHGGLNLTVNTNPGMAEGGKALYVGGAAGSMGTPIYGDPVRVEEVTVVGDITVGSEHDPVNASDTSNVDNKYVGIFVGGLSGKICGNGTNSPAILLNSDYRQGNIRVWSGDGGAVLGGALGQVDRSATVTGCSSLAGSFIIDKKSDLGGFYYAGGFLGSFLRSGDVSDCYSDNQIVISGSSGFTGSVAGGGFAGEIEGELTNDGTKVSVSYCYALGDVSVTGYAFISAGGFAGSMFTNTSASYCYAAGDVYMYSKWVGHDLTSAYNTSAGGFAGVARGLSDCYALGNVFADKSPRGDFLNVGALVGEFGYTTTAKRCFAAGSVIAQRDGTAGGTGYLTAIGGLAGKVYDYGSGTVASFKNSAALGASVTVTGYLATQTQNQAIGRLFGMLPNVPTENNWANNSMRLYADDDYGDGSPDEITSSLTPTPAASNKHGGNAHSGNFHNPDFWRTTLEFDLLDWDFSLVSLKGHPRLRARDGTVMGGQ